MFLDNPSTKEPLAIPGNSITYTLQASAAGCISETQAELIVTSVALSSTQQDILCGGQDNGNIDLAVSGGQSPLEYQWVGPNGFTSSSQDLINLEAGTYVVLVTDRDGCTASLATTLADISSLNIALNSPEYIGGNNISCFQGTNGQINSLITGGTPPYFFSWDDPMGQTSQNATNLTAGIYTLTITDSNGCNSEASITLSQPQAVSGVLQDRINVACTGQATGSATVTGTGGNTGYNYFWNTAPPQSGTTAAGLEAGTYNLTITDLNGCTGTVAVDIEEPEEALSGSLEITNPLCNEDNTGSAAATIVGGTLPYTYLWSFDPSVNDASVSNLAAGTYSLSVTDVSGCEINFAFNISQPDLLVPNILNQTTISCNGLADGSAIANAAGGIAPYSFSWNTDPITTGPAVDNLAAGTYTVSVTDANGCTASANVVITQPEIFSLDLASALEPLCADSTNGAITVSPSGGTSPYSYSWNTVPPTIGETIENIAAGTYTVSAIDASGCQATLDIMLNAPSPITITVSSIQNILCNGAETGSATMIAEGGTPNYQYSWNDANNQTAEMADELSAGTYSVSVTDANGCAASRNITISEPNTPLAVSLVGSINNLCFGENTGSITAIATGGSGSYSYSWNDPNLQSSATASNLPAGIYTLTVSDNNGCDVPATLTVTVTEPAAPLILELIPSLFEGDVNLVCNGDSTATIDLSTSGGTAPYDVQWNLPGLATSSDQDLTGLPAGTYMVTVTDANGCQSSEEQIISAAAPISVTAIATPSICFGLASGSIEASIAGGVSPYSASWSGPNGFSSSLLSLENLEGGVYILTVTDAIGCSFAQAITVTQPDDLIITLDSVSEFGGFNTTCYNSSDGAIFISPSGGNPPYTFQWNTSGNPNFSNQEDVSNLSAGLYEAVLFDGDGCIQNNLIELTAPDTLDLDFDLSFFDNGFNISCADTADGSIEAIPTGGTAPFNFTWIGSNGYGPEFSNPILNLEAGEYSLLLTDDLGCSHTESISIVAPPEFALSASANSINGSNTSCSGASDGSIDLTISGSSSPYSITWTGPVGYTSASEDIAGLQAGEYCATVMDSNSCEKDICITLTQPDTLDILIAPTIYANGFNLNCDDSTDGIIDAAIDGGNAPYIISWSGAKNFTSDQLNINNLGAGIYCLTAIDASGCQMEACATLEAPAPMEIILENASELTCSGAATADIDVSVLGGNPTYTFIWTGPDGFTAGTEDISNLNAGVYCLELTDASDCTAERCFTIAQPQALILNLITSNYNGVEIDCNSNANGAVTAIVSGGNAPYNYGWNGVDGFTSTDPVIDGLSPGTYCLDILDANGCTAQECAIIVEPDLLEINPEILLPACSDGSLAVVDLNVMGGTAPYTFNWSSSENTETVSLDAGIYEVVVSDDNGCLIEETIEIELPAELSIIPEIPLFNGGFNISCADGTNGSISLTIFGGNGELAIQWSGDDGFSSTQANISGLASGQYCVSVTDESGCTADSCLVLTEPQPLSIAFNEEAITCFNGDDGSLSSIISGGVPTYAVSWTGRKVLQPTEKPSQI